MLLLARLVRMITAAVVVVIVAGIVLHLLEANAGNVLVSAVYDVAGWLVTPFKGLFSIDGEKLRIAVNWGIAAIVYGIVGSVIASLLARAALRGRHRDDGYTRRRGVAY
jgi:hypothetical protein